VIVAGRPHLAGVNPGVTVPTGVNAGVSVVFDGEADDVGEAVDGEAVDVSVDGGVEVGESVEDVEVLADSDGVDVGCGVGHEW